MARNADFLERYIIRDLKIDFLEYWEELQI